MGTGAFSFENIVVSTSVYMSGVQNYEEIS